MAILNILIEETGLSGVLPRIVYIDTNSTLAQVTTAGFLNKAVSQGYQFNEKDMALVSTKTTPSAATSQVSWLEISKSGANWSLVSNSSTQALADGDIFVGNASNVATGVTMSGDATISNLGALTIAANAITTTKILNANVTLAKLAAGITPSHIIKFAGKENNGGGSASIAITVTGALATDVVFAQVEASTNAVSVQKVTPSADTVTVLLSGDPGAATVVSYQVLRAAA